MKNIEKSIKNDNAIFGFICVTTIGINDNKNNVIFNVILSQKDKKLFFKDL